MSSNGEASVLLLVSLPLLLLGNARLKWVWASEERFADQVPSCRVR